MLHDASTCFFFDSSTDESAVVFSFSRGGLDVVYMQENTIVFFKFY